MACWMACDVHDDEEPRLREKGQGVGAGGSMEPSAAAARQAQSFCVSDAVATPFVVRGGGEGGDHPACHDA